MEEIFDIYTRDGKHIGTEKKSVCHSENPGVYHKPVWIWIINSKNELLLQKRSYKKKRFPNKWDMPVAGHVRAGETILQGAVREAEEELGIQTKEGDYTFIGEYISDSAWEIGQVYLLKLDLEIKDFKLQEDEVAEVKWISLEELDKIIYSNEFTEIDIEYKRMMVNYFRRYFNKYNLILTSSGFNDINNYVPEDIKNVYKEISKDKKVMILANAAPIGDGNYNARECVKNNFLSIGAKTADIVDIDSSNIESILNYDIIYGLGGNPTHLIELCNNLPFREYMIKFLKNGIYIGESAGTIILCDDLKWLYVVKKGSKPKYDVELDSYKGLNLSNTKVMPHYNRISESIKTKMDLYEKENDISITKLNDGDYILEYYM